MKPTLRTALTMIIALLSLSLAACDGAGPSGLDDLVTMMTGSFSSGAQAEADSSFFDIRLEMAPIWQGREGLVGHYLYVEQAAAWALDKPYRQRVYHVTEEEGGVFRSMVYALPDPAAAVGAWSLDDPLADLSPADLVEREGCAVYLEPRPDGSYEGSTRDRECTSSLRGAVYATSEITIAADRIVSWDRGWDADGNQVWGAEKAGYVFLRVAETKDSP